MTDDKPTQADREGPAPLPTPATLHCLGCRHLKTKWWKDHLDNDETDSGTSARCGAIPDEHGGKSISAYWSERDIAPKWCPHLEAATATDTQVSKHSELADIERAREIAISFLSEPCGDLTGPIIRSGKMDNHIWVRIALAALTQGKPDHV